MELTSGIVCILDAYSRPAGAGFVVSTVMENLIVTCAHVLGEPRPERVTIVFQSTGEQQEAKVIDQWWRSEEAEDVAILRIVGCLPPGVQPLPLGSAKGTVGHDVSTFGFPNVGQVKGMGGDGTVVEQVTTMAGLSLLQLRSSEITPGFSGAPVWDKLKHRVIGMVIEITLPDQYSRLTETAFAVPMETLRTVCPALCISEVCPYRSLEIFTEADTEFFFGRKRVVDELVNSLQQEPHFLAVFGPSGSGKSSVVRAGLLPQLQLGRVSGSDRWEIKVTRPTEHTFEQLLSHLYQETQKQTVLVIDQFEELFVAFSEVVYQEIATRLTGLLESSSRITLILVMRDDFYSRFVQQETLAGWLRRGLVNMPHTLKRDEVVAMIEEPAHAVGLRFQEGLIEIIVDDVLERIVRAKDSGRVSSSTILPLLEFALTQLWERRQEGMMTRNAYEVIGGVTGGLAQWAAREFYSLNEQQRAFTRRIFTDLVYLGNESQGLPNSRQRRSLVSLVHRDDERGIIQHIVGQLTQARLLVASQDDKSNEETIEIIHEALLHEWGQLKEWIREDRDFLNWRQEIERQAKLWVETYRDDPAQCEVGRLLRGRDLTTAVNWLEEREADLDQLIWDFIKVSQRCEQQEEQKWKELYQESE